MVSIPLTFDDYAAVLMIDIDHFKQYNDKYGHQQGDDLIRRIVHVMRTNVRRADSVARYGGEEFVVLMPDTNMKAAIVVAERLRKRVEKTKVLDRDVATISVGVSTLESFDESISPALLLRGADDAM